MQHYVYIDGAISIDTIFEQIPIDHQLIQVKQFQDLLDNIPVDGHIFLVLEGNMDHDFENLRDKYSLQKIVLMSNSIKDDVLKDWQKNRPFFDLFFKYPVVFPEVLKTLRLVSTFILQNWSKPSTDDLSLEIDNSNLELKPISAGENIKQPLDKTLIDPLSLDLASELSIGLTEEKVLFTQIQTNFREEINLDSLLSEDAHLPEPVELKLAPEVSQILSIPSVSWSEQVIPPTSVLENKVENQTVSPLVRQENEGPVPETINHHSNTFSHGEIKSKLIEDISEVRINFEESANLKTSLESSFKEEMTAKHKLEQLTQNNDMQPPMLKNSVDDYRKFKMRESELEERIELLQMDASIQMQHREKKIVELKRKIDLLEFDLKDSFDREIHYKKTINQLEAKLHSLKISLKTLVDQGVGMNLSEEETKNDLIRYAK